MVDSCILMTPMYENYQTVHLEHGQQGWYIYSVDFHDDPPELVECSTF